MGFPPDSDRVLNNKPSTAKALSLELVAPHGARIYATLQGCRIDFAAEHREHVYAWLKGELDRLDMLGMQQEELVQCPDCKGQLKMSANLPVFCTTCKGYGKVRKSTAEAYIATHLLEIAPPIPTEIRPPTFQPVAPLSMSSDGFPVAPTPVIVGKVQPDTDEDDFVAPRPGQEGFIGPLQQRS